METKEYQKGGYPSGRIWIQGNDDYEIIDRLRSTRQSLWYSDAIVDGIRKAVENCGDILQTMNTEHGA